MLTPAGGAGRALAIGNVIMVTLPMAIISKVPSDVNRAKAENALHLFDQHSSDKLPGLHERLGAHPVLGRIQYPSATLTH